MFPLYRNNRLACFKIVVVFEICKIYHFFVVLKLDFLV